MFADQLGQLVRLRAITVEGGIIAAHAAVVAVFAAEVRDFNHGADERLVSKNAAGNDDGSFMQLVLHATV